MAEDVEPLIKQYASELKALPRAQFYFQGASSEQPNLFEAVQAEIEDLLEELRSYLDAVRNHRHAVGVALAVERGAKSSDPEVSRTAALAIPEMENRMREARAAGKTVEDDKAEQVARLRLLLAIRDELTESEAGAGATAG